MLHNDVVEDGTKKRNKTIVYAFGYKVYKVLCMDMAAFFFVISSNIKQVEQELNQNGSKKNGRVRLCSFCFLL